MTDRPTLGSPHPLGVSIVGDGVNVAVFSASATAVDLCLFDDEGTETVVRLPARTAHVHHGHVPGIRAGQRYGLRVHGAWNPAAGDRANPAKLLIDPYARAIDGDVTIGDALLGHDPADPSRRSVIDSATSMPKCIVVDDRFDWGDDRPPATALIDSVIYEAHVRGLSMTHPDVPPELRGTYAGLAHPAIVGHLVGLGVTALELLPVHHTVSEAFLADRGLTNYWGYSTVGFFAPHGGYSASGGRGGQVSEFKELVKTMHAAGIEVLLDVVYNHTNEGGENGPTLSWRGIDNAAYYRLADDRRQYRDVTGTGNTLNVDHPAALRLVMDSLRYWVEVMHVDGFRFDLATALGRDRQEFDPRAAFFDMIHQDPVIGRVKLIAEPWDVGPHGYQLGQFPPGWSEWNARFRDDVRDYWKGTANTLPAFASRITGSADVFDRVGRDPSASINLITAHDGYTLADLVAYERKHNQANGEDNRDGHDDNRSWNGGVEGPTGRDDVIENRARRVRSMLATLLLAQGVPMITGGDELGRTQRGNNNAYAQDNEVSWFDWGSVDADLVAFTRRLIDLRMGHPVFRRRQFLDGRASTSSTLPDSSWFRPDGEPMTVDDWHAPDAGAIAVFLNGDALGPHGPTPEPEVGHSFLVLCNPGSEAEQFTVPDALGGHCWRVMIDTAHPTPTGQHLDTDIPTGGCRSVEAWSVVLLERDVIAPTVEVSS